MRGGLSKLREGGVSDAAELAGKSVERLQPIEGTASSNTLRFVRLPPKFDLKC